MMLMLLGSDVFINGNRRLVDAFGIFAGLVIADMSFVGQWIKGVAAVSVCLT